MLKLFRRSLAARIAAITAALLVLSVASLIFAADYLFKSSTMHRFEASASTTSRLLSDQMSGGVKWMKAASVEKILAPVIQAETNDTLQSVRVVGADATELIAMTAGEVGAQDAGLSLDPLKIASERGSASIANDAGIVRIEPIFDPKKTDQMIGAAMFVWSTESVRNDIQTTGLYLAGLAVLGVASTLGLLMVILSREVVRPISALQQTMGRIAGGDLESETPAVAGENEIADMGQAVRVLRENAIAARQLEVEKREAEDRARAEREAAREAELKAEAAEQERAAKTAKDAARRELADQEAERRREAEEARRAEAHRLEAEETRRKTMERLSEAFGDVVSAAAEGDFSRRVEADFDDPELRQIAESLNSMAGVVASALDDTCAVLGAIGRYDLSQRMRGDYRGGFATLRDGVNGAADTLADMVERMQAAVGALTAQTGRLKHGFDDLSNRTGRQAAQVQETSAAVRMLAGSVQQSAGRAAEARDKTKLVSAEATAGGAVMQDATAVMDVVVKSSDEIAAIVDLIDRIASQTNLLSLNASVEAARAGEAGAGFAVVAAEVRALAQSAAESSSEIRSLIQRNRDEIKRGSDLVAKGNGAFTAITGAIEEATSLTTDISLDAKEQADRISELSGAVSVFDDATQQNAQLVSDSTAAIAETSRDVREIEEMAMAFSLGDRGKQRHVSALAA